MMRYHSPYMDRIHLLYVFTRIAATKSFSLTAEQLAMPRSSVSKAMKTLEAQLGSRLLHRSTRQVSLTEDGEALFHRASLLLSEMESLQNMFRPEDTELSGRLRINVPSRIASQVLAPALPALLEAHPRLEIELGADDRAIDLVKEGVDCALRVGQVLDTNLVAKKLGTFAMLHCASPAYIAKHGVPAAPDCLNGHQIINYALDAEHTTMWRWDEDGHNRSLSMHSQVSVHHAESYLALALAGMGIVQIPRFDALGYLSSGQLVEVLTQAAPAAMPVHILYPHRRHVPLRVKTFISWMEHLLAPHIDVPNA